MPVMDEQGQIQIHTENIFPIIKKAVYSGHEVFLRELVSNGVDAISNSTRVVIPSPVVSSSACALLAPLPSSLR